MWTFLIEGGPFMIPMVLTSIVGLAFMIERGLALRWPRVIPPDLEKSLQQCNTPEELERLKGACQHSSSTLARLTSAAIEHLGWNKAENTSALETLARRESVRLERGLVILEIIVGVAPLLGLVGTIHGLIRLFGGLGNPGQADNARLAAGIAIAFNTTLMGLMIAIPALVVWSYFRKKVEILTVELEALLDGFLRRQYRPQRKN